MIAVGMTMTEMIEANIEAARPVIEKMEARNPLGRIGRLDDLEGIVIYLASDLSRYHTGDTITIDDRTSGEVSLRYADVAKANLKIDLSKEFGR